MNQVEVTGPGTITGQFDYDGITFYGWTFPVVVNGQAGVYTVWVDTNNPADEGQVAADAIDDLQQDPGGMQGISENDDSGTNMGDFGDPTEPGDSGDDDGGDGALAGGGDIGDSA